MPTYEYECFECGNTQEHSFPITADRPQEFPCECGDVVQAVISKSAGSDLFVKDRPFEFKKEKCVMSFGNQFGRSPDQQHKVYVDKIKEMRDLKSQSRSGKKADIEWLGTMPGEMVDSIGRHEGDQEAVVKDPVGYLKRTGLYEGD